MVKPHPPREFRDFTRIDLRRAALASAALRAGALSARRIRAKLWLVLTVVVPGALAGLYYFAIAADLYLSESKFVVRSAARIQPSPFGAFLQNAGLARAQDETFSVHDFILSRDAVRALEDGLGLRAILGRPEADVLARFPNWMSGDSFEALYDSYRDLVSVSVDGTTGISTLRVKAFRAADARAVSLALLELGEQLVNRLNERARRDAMSAASAEVQLSERRISDLQGRITEFRVRENMLDPGKASAFVLDLVARLTQELAAMKTQLTELSAASPNSPQIPNIRNRIAALEKQIREELSKVVGADDAIVGKLSEYERLLIEREFANKALASATASLEAARAEAQRQQLYLERVVEPNLADYALYPRRIVAVLTVLGSCLIAYGIGWLLFASVREHASR